eukprot:scaffold9331_cov116-Isochrysis_galbana.AAC.7
MSPFIHPEVSDAEHALGVPSATPYECGAFGTPCGGCGGCCCVGSLVQPLPACGSTTLKTKLPRPRAPRHAAHRRRDGHDSPALAAPAIAHSSCLLLCLLREEQQSIGRQGAALRAHGIWQDVLVAAATLWQDCTNVHLSAEDGLAVSGAKRGPAGVIEIDYARRHAGHWPSAHAIAE